MTKYEIKNKLACFADKVTSSKAYKTAEKTAVSAGAGLITVGSMAMTSFAESGVGSVVLSEVNSGDVLKNAMPFINIGLPVLVVVAGIRLGMRFLRGCLH